MVLDLTVVGPRVSKLQLFKDKSIKKIPANNFKIEQLLFYRDKKLKENFVLSLERLEGTSLSIIKFCKFFMGLEGIQSARTSSKINECLLKFNARSCVVKLDKVIKLKSGDNIFDGNLLIFRVVMDDN